MPKLPAPPELSHIRWAVAQGMLTSEEDFHVSLARWLLEDEEPDDDKRKDDDREKDDDGSEPAENTTASSGSSGARVMDADRKKDDDKKKDDEGAKLATSDDRKTEASGSSGARPSRPRPSMAPELLRDTKRARPVWQGRGG